MVQKSVVLFSSHCLFFCSSLMRIMRPWEVVCERHRRKSCTLWCQFLTAWISPPSLSWTPPLWEAGTPWCPGIMCVHTSRWWQSIIYFQLKTEIILVQMWPGGLFLPFGGKNNIREVGNYGGGGCWMTNILPPRCLNKEITLMSRFKITTN